MLPYPGSIDTARRALRSGQMTPAGLIGATLERIQAHNSSLNAYIDVFDPPDIGISDGALAGIPIAIKDLIDVAGHRTTGGSRFPTEPAAEDAFVVKRLREAGAAIMGKTNLHEWAHGTTNINPHFGACRNPWDTGRISGGSSGGSAAAIAAGLCLGALGSDSGGSIRLPAALCGIAGLKPTYGRVSLRGVAPLSWSLDTVGPMARTVLDTALLLQVIADHDRLDPVSADAPAPDYVRELQGQEKLAGVRVGVPLRHFFEEADTDVAETVQTAIDVLRAMGAVIEEINLPDAAEMFTATGVMMMAEASAYHRERYVTRPDLFGDDVRERIRIGLTHTGVDYALARRAQSEWQHRLKDVFASVDAIVTPTTPIPAIRFEEAAASAGRLTRFTRQFNLAGIPALTAPCGFVRRDDRLLPVGMQIAGRWWDEMTILRVAHAYEQATRWHTQPPALFSDG